VNYARRLLLLVTMDIALIWSSLSSAYIFRFQGEVPQIYWDQMLVYALVCSVLVPVFMYVIKAYRHVWEYASIRELLSIIQVIFITQAVAYPLTYLFTGSVVPISVYVLALETMIILIGGIRFASRLIRWRLDLRRGKPYRALIVGAGSCGRLIAVELQRNQASQMNPVGFIDDDVNKKGLIVAGLPVFGGRQVLAETVQAMGVHEIIIAMPSVSRQQLSAIIEMGKTTGAKLKMIPHYNDLIHGKVSINEIREVDVGDLLGREQVKVDLDEISGYLRGKTVLVTGAGGTIGSELCKQIAAFAPHKLILLGHGENSIFLIEQELRRLYSGLNLVSIIADVQDRERMFGVFEQHLPQVVFHAAAHKHVPIMENNPSEAIKNNVLGTKNTADASSKYKAERFILISTDKAVNPTSVMGVTKRIAEMYVQSLRSECKFGAVRFGNVLGSRGSVIPTFKQQIKHGGPVKVTHPEMIRYFMTVTEAVQLVIQAGAWVEGGEVFVLDMGNPVKILQLAEDLIRLSGFEPHNDIKIEFTGIRPGEKLYEELLTSEEGLTSTCHNRIFIGRPASINSLELDFNIKRLEKNVGTSAAEIKELLKLIVPTYHNVS